MHILFIVIILSAPARLIRINIKIEKILEIFTYKLIFHHKWIVLWKPYFLLSYLLRESNKVLGKHMAGQIELEVSISISV